MNNVTTNFADFGARERHELIELLQAWEDNGLPDDFNHEDVVPMFNINSGFVFFTNSDYQAAAINPETGFLESFYSTPYSGYEGFFNELVEQYQDNPDDWDEEDVEFLRDLGANV